MPELFVRWAQIDLGTRVFQTKWLDFFLQGLNLKLSTCTGLFRL